MTIIKQLINLSNTMKISIPIWDREGFDGHTSYFK